MQNAYALEPQSFLRSLDASRTTLGKPRVKLIDIVAHVRTLTDDASYAVVGGLAQILWARKTHTDDIDIALASSHLKRAFTKVEKRRAGASWRLPQPPDLPHEENAVFEVYHLSYRGSVVDLLSFKDESFNAEILATARVVPELGDLHFIRPELLLVTHLLRPGAHAALAAVELVLARRAFGDLRIDYARKWASQVGREPSFDRTLKRADEIASNSG